MNTEPREYITYMLRLWRAGDGDSPSWRAMLENPRTGERQVFANLVELFSFIAETTRDENRRHPSEQHSRNGTV
jgi:hypothetical protein